MKKTNNNFDIDNYRKKGFIARQPVWLKVLVVKSWFAGAVFYFIGFGFFNAHPDDLPLILGLALGVSMDILVNPILRHLDGYDKEYSEFAIFGSKKYYTFLLNLILYTIISFLIAYTYNVINIAYNTVFNMPEYNIVLGVEPILYGLFFVMYDSLFLGIKKIFKKKKE